MEPKPLPLPVSFDPKLVEAKLALKRIGPDEMPALAWDVFEAGLDGPSIRRLAALTNPSCPFARYADDAVVHCRTRTQAEEVMRSIALRLAECGLTMHPEKSKVVYCKDSNRTASHPHVSFTFLGFTFRPRKAINRRKKAFTNFLPGVSADALKRIRTEVRGWRIHRQTPGTLDELALQYNPKIRGWWNYFGAFYRSAMQRLSQFLDEKFMQWARRKYKALWRRKTCSARWLRRMKKQSPRLFFHWTAVGSEVG